MLCKKCNNEISKYDRCCTRCGYINDNYQEDQKFQYNMKLNHIEDYQKFETPSINTTVINKPYLKYFFYSISLLTILAFFKSFIDSELFRYMDSFFVLFLFFTVINFYLSCLAMLFAKSGSVWWYALIPIYNLFILSKLAFKRGLLFLLIFIPIIQIIFIIIFIYYLSKKFEFNFWLLLFLFPITFPILAFSKKYQYQDYYEYAK